MFVEFFVVKYRIIMIFYYDYIVCVQVFKLKENVYITEFELSVDYCFNCMAAVLSDSTAIYVISDNSNVFRGLIAKQNIASNKMHDRNLIYKCVAINPLYKIVVFGCKKFVVDFINIKCALLQTRTIY